MCERDDEAKEVGDAFAVSFADVGDDAVALVPLPDVAVVGAWLHVQRRPG